MLLLVRDEIDIVEDNLKFHLDQGVDEVLVTDNGSIDGTRDLLSDLARSYPITVFDEPGRDHSQWRWMTQLAGVARADHGADWLLPNDADEFWWAGGQSLKAALTEELSRLAPDVNMLRCRRFNMVYGHDDVSADPWHRRLRYRRAVPLPRKALANPITDPRSDPHFYFDLPGKVLLRAAGLSEIAEGNHGATFETGAVAADSQISIYHYPVRSRAQFITKSCNGGRSYARNTELGKNIGWHQRRWYAMYENGGADAALNDAIPSTARLSADLDSGAVIEDTTLIATFDRLRQGG